MKNQFLANLCPSDWIEPIQDIMAHTCRIKSTLEGRKSNVNLSNLNLLKLRKLVLLSIVDVTNLPVDNDAVVLR